MEGLSLVPGTVDVFRVSTLNVVGAELGAADALLMVHGEAIGVGEFTLEAVELGVALSNEANVVVEVLGGEERDRWW